MKKTSKKSEVVEVFVFTLRDAVFFPNTAIPLNVFEPRYIKMINQSIDTKTPIALLPSTILSLKSKKPNDSERFMSVISGIGHPVILKENEDGAMMILLEGVGKVELGEVVAEKPVLTCRALLIEENDKVDEENRFRFNRLKKNLQEWIKHNIKEDYYKQVLLQNLRSPQQIVESLSMLLVKEAEKRQGVLETNDINDKIEYITKILDSGWFEAKKPPQKKAKS